MLRSLYVIDTETTGFPRRSLMCPVRPIQFGAVLLDPESLEELDAIELLLNPEVWPPGYAAAEKIHGITRARAEMVGFSMKSSFRRMLDWISDHRKKRGGYGQILAWNASFDHQIMDRWAHGAGSDVYRTDTPPWPDWRRADLRAPGGCLMQMWRTYCAGTGSRATSLSASLKALDMPEQRSPHTALEDARSAAVVLRAMVKP